MLKDFSITKVVLTFILPFILLYALHIQFNGELSPGGGFQAGAIFASAMIAYELIFGQILFNNQFPPRLLVTISAGGVTVYGFTGLFALYQDSNFLDYSALLADPLAAQHLGITLIEIGVGMTVATTMCLIYALLRDEENAKIQK